MDWPPWPAVPVMGMWACPERTVPVVKAMFFPSPAVPFSPVPSWPRWQPRKLAAAAAGELILGQYTTSLSVSSVWSSIKTSRWGESSL